MPGGRYNESVERARSALRTGGDQSEDAHERLLNFIRKLKRTATDAITDQVDLMRKADSIYHAFRQPDDQDKKAAERGEPVKIIYPVSYAQIQTTLAALMTIFDRKPFFPLDSRQPQFYRSSKLMELELDYQLEQAGWTLIFYQALQDMLKYGFFALEVNWLQEKVFIRQNTPVPILGALFGMTTQTDQPVVGYEGTHFELNDPYQFKFDPSFSVGEIQKSQYVFSTWKESYNGLKVREQPNAQYPKGEFFNVDNVPERTASFLSKTTDRGRERELLGEDAKSSITHGKSEVKGGDIVLLDTCYVKLVPADYDLSELESVQIWKITMANESTIIQAEPSLHEHGLFPVVVGEYNPDRHELLNDGMAQVIDGLQDLMNWLLNTHITNVRKSLNDILIVDPGGVELEDLKARKPVIRLKPTAKAGIDRYIKQLQIVDVTQNHVRDVATIFEILQRTTGVNDNTMGQLAPTVRTATETANVQRLAQGRMSLLARLLWDQALRPLGKQMIQNTQQFASQERYLKVTGGLANALGVPPELASAMNGMVKASPSDLQGFFSIEMIDATTPTDKMMIASMLKEFLAQVMQNPLIIPLLGADISQIATQMLMNSGIRNTTDFIRPPNPALAQQMLVELAMQQKLTQARGVQAQVMPDEQVQRMQKEGNVLPMEGANNGRGV